MPCFTSGTATRFLHAACAAHAPMLTPLAASQTLSSASAATLTLASSECRLLQVAVKAATALGYMCYRQPSAAEHEAMGKLRAAAVQALLGTAGTKSQALQFAVGEALCFAFGGAS